MRPGGLGAVTRDDRSGFNLSIRGQTVALNGASVALQEKEKTEWHKLAAKQVSRQLLQG